MDSCVTNGTFYFTKGYFFPLEAIAESTTPVPEKSPQTSRNSIRINTMDV